MNIGVFCSQYDVADKYQKAAQRLGELIGQGGHNLVWGGHTEGLVGIISDTTKRSGGRIIGVIREGIKHRAKKDADEIYITRDAHEMNLGIINRSDAIVALVGGIGTLNELTEIIRMNKNGENAKVVVMINTDNFYEGLKQQLTRMAEEGFIRPEVASSVHFADSPEDAMRYIEMLNS